MSFAGFFDNILHIDMLVIWHLKGVMRWLMLHAVLKMQ